MNSVTKERSNSNRNYHNIKYTILVMKLYELLEREMIHFNFGW